MKLFLNSECRVYIFECDSNSNPVLRTNDFHFECKFGRGVGGKTWVCENKFVVAGWSSIALNGGGIDNGNQWMFVGRWEGEVDFLLTA